MREPRHGAAAHPPRTNWRRRRRSRAFQYPSTLLQLQLVCGAVWSLAPRGCDEGSFCPPQRHSPRPPPRVRGGGRRSVPVLSLAVVVTEGSIEPPPPRQRPSRGAASGRRGWASAGRDASALRASRHADRAARVQRHTAAPPAARNGAGWLACEVGASVRDFGTRRRGCGQRLRCGVSVEPTPSPSPGRPAPAGADRPAQSTPRLRSHQPSLTAPLLTSSAQLSSAQLSPLDVHLSPPPPSAYARLSPVLLISSPGPCRWL
jgi:hypothetical protein